MNWTSLALFVFLSCFCFGAPARAQSVPPVSHYTPGQAFPVDVVMTRSNVRFAVLRGKVPLATCTGRCRVELPFGSYLIDVHEGDETAGGRIRMQVTGPGVVRIKPESQSTHTKNKVMAIGGTTLAGLGLLTVVAAMMSGMCAPGCQPAETPEERRREEDADRTRIRTALAGAGIMVVGGVLATVGWIGFADSRRPDVDSARRERKHGPRFRVGVMPVTKGAAISGVLAF